MKEQSVTQITHGIRITVSPFFKDIEYNGDKELYGFFYKIDIENNTEHPVQLLSRFWKITEASGLIRYVEGDGVVGKQPLLYPGESFQYMSYAFIESEVGKMEGNYTMHNKFNNEEFIVTIPSFVLISPAKLN